VGRDLTGLAFKVKKLGNFRPAHYSLHPPHSQEREREKLIPFFFFSFHHNLWKPEPIGKYKRRKKINSGNSN